jgi:TIR domain
MPFEYACFISYAHGEHKLMQTFMTELTEALESSLEPYLDIDACTDRKLLRPGVLLDVALARAICRSVCMVVVYSPRYERHPYCRREYEAIQRLQRRRFQAIGNGVEPENGMIIPVVFRGKRESLPVAIRDHIHYMDFRGLPCTTRGSGATSST